MFINYIYDKEDLGAVAYNGKKLISLYTMKELTDNNCGGDGSLW